MIFRNHVIFIRRLGGYTEACLFHVLCSDPCWLLGTCCERM